MPKIYYSILLIVLPYNSFPLKPYPFCVMYLITLFWEGTYDCQESLSSHKKKWLKAPAMSELIKLSSLLIFRLLYLGILVFFPTNSHVWMSHLGNTIWKILAGPLLCWPNVFVLELCLPLANLTGSISPKFTGVLTIRPLISLFTVNLRDDDDISILPPVLLSMRPFSLSEQSWVASLLYNTHVWNTASVHF